MKRAVRVLLGKWPDLCCNNSHASASTIYGVPVIMYFARAVSTARDGWKFAKSFQMYGGSFEVVHSETFAKRPK